MARASQSRLRMMERRIESCASCPVGRAAGVVNGGRCPFTDVQRRRGDTVYDQGSPAERVYFLKRGTVVLLRGDGRERVTAVRGPATFIGLEALVGDVYRDTAQTTTPATLCSASRTNVDAWLGPRMAPARMMLEQTLRAIDEPARAAAPDGNASTRVARWLLTQGSEIPVQRRHLASLLGMVPETFSRALASLTKVGAIESTPTRIRIVDGTALNRAAGTDAS